MKENNHEPPRCDVVIAVAAVSLAALSLADPAISIAAVKTLKIDRGLSAEGKACITCHQQTDTRAGCGLERQPPRSRGHFLYRLPPGT